MAIWPYFKGMTRPNNFLEWYEIWTVYSDFNVLQKLLTEFCSQIYKKNGIGPELHHLSKNNFFFLLNPLFRTKKLLKKTITFLIFGGYREEEWGYKFFSILFNAIRWFWDIASQKSPYLTKFQKFPKFERLYFVSNKWLLIMH